MKKILSLTILALILMTIMPTVVFAQEENEPANLFSGLLSGIANFFEKLAEIEFKIFNEQPVNLLIATLVFIILFSVFYPATSKIPVFSESSNARKAFSVSLALLVVYFTSLTKYVQSFLTGYFNALALWGLILLFLVLVVWMNRSAGSKFAIMKGMKAESAKVNAEAKASLRDTKLEEKLAKKEFKTAKKIGSKTKDLKNQWIKFVKDLNEMKTIGGKQAHDLASRTLHTMTASLKTESEAERLSNDLEALRRRSSAVERDEFNRLREATKDTTNENVRRNLEHAERRLRTLRGIEAEIGREGHEISTLNSEFRANAEEAISQTRNGAYSSALTAAERAVKDLNKEERDLIQVENMCTQMTAIENSVQTFINSARQEENRGASQPTS
ncbi:hypothetical protein CMO90_01135 [Candidatus Woesearchaeota archaeon]|jgi:hypothetical protein|nr:hypothetical protein [Candidatus Woesearchaeota archaeon]|tara:strand:- start:960 stop:2123 length:1164 start_codon:yes stop_codon:yes gene_type:complete